MSQQTNEIYEFGPFRLDAQERLLRRDGTALPLMPKAFDLLLALVERHGRLVGKEELFQTVWPDMIVEESNLSHNIAIIRKALGDGENGQKFIETVPRRGYRFVALVQEQEEPVAAGPKPQTLSSARGIGRPIDWIKRRPALVISLAILLLIGAASAIIFQPTWRRPNAPGAAIKSIAVLPLRALHSSERDESLEMGATSILITRLGSLRQLIVRPESSVERYARPDQDPLAAGREQKVDAVLDGRYQRSGDKYRFTLRLLRVADGATLWADTLDQQAAGLFAIEDALSIKVTGALRLTLSDADKELLAKRYTNSAEAWQLYVRGRHLLHQRRIPDVEKAITYFERAIALDHGFALAHAKLGFSYASLSNLGHSPPKVLMPKAKAAFDQALKLDDQLAEAHSYLAQYKIMYEWDYGGAEQEHRRAIDINPNSADVHNLHAFYLRFMGRFDQAIAESRRAEELDPTDMFISISVSMILFFARRYDEAIEQARRVVDLNPNWGPGYNWMIRAYEMKGDEQRTFAAYLKQAEADGVGQDEIAGMKAAFAAGGLKGHWRRMLDRLLEREKRGFVTQLDIALLYARLGEKDRALARLQNAVEDHNLFVGALNIEPYDAK